MCCFPLLCSFESWPLEIHRLRADKAATHEFKSVIITVITCPHCREVMSSLVVFFIHALKKPLLVFECWHFVHWITFMTPFDILFIQMAQPRKKLKQLKEAKFTSRKLKEPRTKKSEKWENTLKNLRNSRRNVKHSNKKVQTKNQKNVQGLLDFWCWTGPKTPWNEGLYKRIQKVSG